MTDKEKTLRLGHDRSELEIGSLDQPGVSKMVNRPAVKK